MQLAIQDVSAHVEAQTARIVTAVEEVTYTVKTRAVLASFVFVLISAFFLGIFVSFFITFSSSCTVLKQSA